MLEVGAVVLTRGQQRDRRLAFEAARGDARQRLQEVLGIVVDGSDAVAGEEVGEHVHHRFPVLQHVGDAGRRARIVLQHEEIALRGAHDVDADDVAVDAERRLDAHHLGNERRVADDQLLGDLAGLDDLLAMVDVVHEGVERAHALLDAGREATPLGGRNDSRDDVEGDEALGRFLLAVHREGDAGAAEHGLGLEQLLLEVVQLLVPSPLGHGGIGQANAGPSTVHLIESLAQPPARGFDRRLFLLLFLLQLPPRLPNQAASCPQTGKVAANRTSNAALVASICLDVGQTGRRLMRLATRTALRSGHRR